VLEREESQVSFKHFRVLFSFQIFYCLLYFLSDDFDVHYLATNLAQLRRKIGLTRSWQYAGSRDIEEALLDSQTTSCNETGLGRFIKHIVFFLTELKEMRHVSVSSQKFGI
jgi:hypothetical protein